MPPYDGSRANACHYWLFGETPVTIVERERVLYDVDVEVDRRIRILDDVSRARTADAMVARGLSRLGESFNIAGTNKTANDATALVSELWYRSNIPFGPPSVATWELLTTALGIAQLDVAAALDFYTGLVSEQSQALVLPEIYRDLDAAARAYWTEVEDEDRPLLLLELKQRIESLERVRFYVAGQIVTNADVATVLAQCAAASPTTWSMSDLALATLVRLWAEAGFCLQEYNQAIVSLPHVVDYAIGRRNDYCRSAAVELPQPPATFADLSHSLRFARQVVERTHLRCLRFDGGNWERREFLLTRASIDRVADVPDDLRKALDAQFGCDITLDAPDLLKAAVESCIDAGSDPVEVLKCVAQWAADTDELPTDYVVLTAPVGNKLDRPWELDYQDVACYVAFRTGFAPAVDGVPLDHVGITNVIGQRMRYNVVKKAQNYSMVKRFPPQSFNLPDIASAEDANHEGHRASGIRQSCRIPTAIRYRGLVWKGLADVRLNRTVYGIDREFRPSDIPLAARYARWLGWAIDAIYARDALIDPSYGKLLQR